MSDYTPERWAFLKALRPSAPRWVHISISYRNEEVVGEDGVTRFVQRRINHGSYRKKKG